MAVPTNAVQTFAAIGIREEISDMITNISPMDVPFYSMCKKGKTKSRTPEWLKDEIRAANANNAAVEGDDVTGDSMGQPSRVKNVVQLFDETVIVTDTAQAVDTAGRANELGYQVMKTGKALKRDMEAAITSKNASVVGGASTAGKLGGAESWIETNDSVGTGGAAGGYNSGTGVVDAPTDGTQRAFTEALLKPVIKATWEAGGDPRTIMVGGFNKQALSGFAGIATQYRENSGSRQATILGAADVYVSDFGEHRVIPNRFQRDRSALVLDMGKWEIKFLQPFGTVPLARTGHSEKRLLKAELTLCCAEEKANGIVRDLTTS